MEAARPASEVDIEAVTHLADEAVTQLREQRGGALWLAHLPADVLDAGALRELLEDPAYEVAVGTIDGVPVGYVVAERVEIRSPGTGLPEPLAVIRQLYVEPDARSVGVGEALVELVLAWARAGGCIGVEGFALPGDRATKNLFERYGLVARAILVHRSLEDDA
jgi:GNAT superfamily N-acetyltransferase